MLILLNKFSIYDSVTYLESSTPEGIEEINPKEEAFVPYTSEYRIILVLFFGWLNTIDLPDKDSYHSKLANLFGIEKYIISNLLIFQVFPNETQGS